MSRGPLREAREWLRAIRALRRLRSRSRRPPLSPAGPGAPPRPAVTPRPDDDPALRARLGEWRGRPAPAGAPATALSAADAAEADRTLLALRAQMAGPAAEAIEAHLAAGTVTARRLRPGDGYVWEMPGMRVFAIVGVQAFTVEDPPA